MKKVFIVGGTGVISSNIDKGLNNIGNIVNGGFVAKQGDWIYYSNRLDENKLYKIKTNGTSIFITL